MFIEAFRTSIFHFSFAVWMTTVLAVTFARAFVLTFFHRHPPPHCLCRCRRRHLLLFFSFPTNQPTNQPQPKDRVLWGLVPRQPLPSVAALDLPVPPLVLAPLSLQLARAAAARDPRQHGARRLDVLSLDPGLRHPDGGVSRGLLRFVQSERDSKRNRSFVIHGKPFESYKMRHT